MEKVDRRVKQAERVGNTTSVKDAKEGEGDVNIIVVWLVNWSMLALSNKSLFFEIHDTEKCPLMYVTTNASSLFSLMKHVYSSHQHICPSIAIRFCDPKYVLNKVCGHHHVLQRHTRVQYRSLRSFRSFRIVTSPAIPYHHH